MKLGKINFGNLKATTTLDIVDIIYYMYVKEIIVQ